MSSKKRWVSKLYESQCSSNATLNYISWSSSSEDSDENLEQSHECDLKKFKLDLCDRKNQDSMGTKPQKDNLQLLSSKVVDSQSKLQITNRSFTDSDCLFVNGSPIIDGIKLEELSPILSQSFERENSPILGNHRIFKVKQNERQSLESKRNEKANANSPDLFLSQMRNEIDSESPKEIQPRNLVIDSPVTEDGNSLTPLKIDPFPSQDSSTIVIQSSTDSSIKSDPSFLYHQLPPRKKRFKNGTLAHQVQKVVEVQKARAAIWAHEIFLNKSYDTDLNILNEIKRFYVDDLRRDYGCTSLECYHIDDDKNIKSIELKNKSILILGFNISRNLSFRRGSVIELYPPYQEQIIKYEDINLKCYYNISKLLCL